MSPLDIVLLAALVASVIVAVAVPKFRKAAMAAAAVALALLGLDRVARRLAHRSAASDPLPKPKDLRREAADRGAMEGKRVDELQKAAEAAAPDRPDPPKADDVADRMNREWAVPPKGDRSR